MLLDRGMEEMISEHYLCKEDKFWKQQYKYQYCDKIYVCSRCEWVIGSNLEECKNNRCPNCSRDLTEDIHGMTKLFYKLALGKEPSKYILAHIEVPVKMPVKIGEVSPIDFINSIKKE